MIYKRGKQGIYSYRFRVRGVIHHRSCHTTSGTAARAVERAERLKAESASGLLEHRVLASTFGQAAAVWIEGRSKARSKSGELLSPKTVSIGVVALQHLVPVFGRMSPRHLSVEALLDYQAKRLGEGAATRTVNIELQTLRQILIDSGYGECWRQLRDRKAPDGRQFHMLRENKNAGRALSAEEARKLLDVAKGLGSAVYTAITLSLNTSMRRDEIRTLRWVNIDFEHRSLEVAKSKTPAGEGRSIPLNQAALTALLEWARTFPDRVPSHFVFPRTEGRHLDPTRHADGWRTAWRHALRLAGIRCRFHDLRVSCITALSEGQASEQTIMAIAGHLSKEMLQHYSKIRDGAKRSALDVLVNQKRNQVPGEDPDAPAILLN